eukprot:COSAG02_NODE_2990_length_7607_cov_3.437134_4_plen_123_part_00
MALVMIIHHPSRRFRIELARVCLLRSNLSSTMWRGNDHDTQGCRPARAAGLPLQTSHGATGSAMGVRCVVRPWVSVQCRGNSVSTVSLAFISTAWRFAVHCFVAGARGVAAQRVDSAGGVIA